MKGIIVHDYSAGLQCLPSILALSVSHSVCPRILFHGLFIVAITTTVDGSTGILFRHLFLKNLFVFKPIELIDAFLLFCVPEPVYSTVDSLRRSSNSKKQEGS